MKRKFKAGTTSVTLPIRVRDSSSTTGAYLAGLAYNTASLAAKYRRQGDSSWTTITLVTATAGTFTSGGFCAAGSAPTGAYELHVPNAAFASGAEWAEVELYGAANMVPVSIEIELDVVDYQTTAFGALTTLGTNAPANWLNTAAFADGAITAAKASVNVTQLADDTTAATRLKHMANSVVSGTVAADGTNSSSSFKTDLTETATDYFGGSLGGCVLVFVSSANNAVQARRISAYNGTTKFVTVESAFDATPTDADTFVILGRIEV